MDIATSLAIVAFAALIHASFQLSVSTLSLMSGHAIGLKRSHGVLLRHIAGFNFGALVMTTLLFCLIALIALRSFGTTTPAVAWVVACGLLCGIGIAIWLFYYRRDHGTTLWIPRSLARYLTERSKRTRRSAEAFGLGLSSVIGELLFIIAPLAVSVLATIHLPWPYQLLAIGIYALVSMLSLFIVTILVGGGHKLSAIQRWREKHKYFLQFSAGLGMIILGFYVYVNEVVAVSVAAGGF